MDSFRIRNWIEGTNDVLPDSPISGVFEDVPLDPVATFSPGQSSGTNGVTKHLMYGESRSILWDVNSSSLITTDQQRSLSHTHHDQDTSMISTVEVPRKTSEEQATVQTRNQFAASAAARSSSLESIEASDVMAGRFCWRSEDLLQVRQPVSNSTGSIDTLASDESTTIWTDAHHREITTNYSSDRTEVYANRVHFDLCSHAEESESQYSSHTSVDLTELLNPSETGSLLEPQLQFRRDHGCLSSPIGQLLSGNPFELTPSECESTTMSSLSQHSDIGTMTIKRAPSKHVKTRGGSHTALPQDTTFENSSESSDSFVDIPIPIFPYENLTTRCRERGCPIKGKHEKGPYLHQGKLRCREGKIFGASNPPPEVWEAYDRLKSGEGEGGVRKDSKLVTNFAKYHFGQPREWSPDGVDRCDKVTLSKGSGFQQKIVSFRLWAWI